MARRKHYKISANLSEAGLRKVNELKAEAKKAKNGGSERPETELPWPARVDEAVEKAKARRGGD